MATKFFNLDTDSTFAANSDFLIPSQKAIKTAMGEKQDTLSTDQMSAVNSGITNTKVATYDSYEETKQDVIEDIADIRSGSALGSTAVQPSEIAEVAFSGSYNDLKDKPAIGTGGTTITIKNWN